MIIFKALLEGVVVDTFGPVDYGFMVYFIDSILLAKFTNSLCHRKPSFAIKNKSKTSVRIY